MIFYFPVHYFPAVSQGQCKMDILCFVDFIIFVCSLFVDALAYIDDFADSTSNKISRKTKSILYMNWVLL